MRPQSLPPNVLRHFYAGGPRIAALRGFELESDHMPEEWLGAANSAFGDPERGLSRLADGTLVRDAVIADPEAWLGPEHVARYGADPALLVKLLDAGQRLPVHVHPGREFARAAFDCPYGKTEAWIVVEAEPGARMHAGLRRDVGPEELRRWMREQDSAAMLEALHDLPVTAGDTLFVPAGTPHAIGAGILLVELQEPTDFSVLLEWDGFELEEDDGHLDLGWDRALQALDAGRPAAVRGPRDGRRLLPEAADPYFRAERVAGGDALDPGFSVLVALAGEGALGDLPLSRGDAVLVPHAAGALELTGDVTAIRCRPPDPAAPERPW